MAPEHARTLLLTCEHGGNALPPAFAPLFAGSPGLMASHRAADWGALALARALARHFAAPLWASTTSRLLVDLNRSVGHPQLHHPKVRALGPKICAAVVKEHHTPHRRAVRAAVAARRARGLQVVHVAVHSFTPVLAGVRRTTDVGLLFDPARPAERDVCRRWQRAWDACVPAPGRAPWRLRLNAPYDGRDDGLTRDLRRLFADPGYVGIELEVNQRLMGPGRRPRAVHLRALEGSLDAALRPKSF